MGGWPFVAAMMADADCRNGYGASAKFGGPGWTFDFGQRGGGRRRRRMFGSGELRLVLLKLLADEPRHGYELMKAIEELTEGSYAPSPGTIYPTLALLEDEGAIAQAAGDETRKAYEATAAGRTELEERADEVAALFERLSGHGEHRRAYATPECSVRSAISPMCSRTAPARASSMRRRCRRSSIWSMIWRRRSNGSDLLPFGDPREKR